MRTFANFRRDWLTNVPTELLSGALVALALIPEAIGFSIVAGVDPKVGLYASFSIAVTSAILGGRRAMISAATASTAVLMITLVRDHGLQYLFAATILMGLLQVVAGAARLGLVMKFVSRSVMTGFVNALAILIFMAQLPQFVGADWHMYAMVAAGLAVIYLFPLLTKRVPSALVSIIVITAFSIMAGMKLRTVGDMGPLPSSLPLFGVPQVPFTLETLRIIFPYSLAMAAVGLLAPVQGDEVGDVRGSRESRGALAPALEPPVDLPDGVGDDDSGHRGTSGGGRRPDESGRGYLNHVPPGPSPRT